MRNEVDDTKRALQEVRADLETAIDDEKARRRRDRKEARNAAFVQVQFYAAEIAGRLRIAATMLALGAGNERALAMQVLTDVMEQNADTIEREHKALRARRGKAQEAV